MAERRGLSRSLHLFDITDVGAGSLATKEITMLRLPNACSPHSAAIAARLLRAARPSSLWKAGGCSRPRRRRRRSTPMASCRSMGTNKSDVIVVELDASDATKLDVTVNGTMTQFDASAVTGGVHVAGGNGSDDIEVHEATAGEFTLPVNYRGRQRQGPPRRRLGRR